MTKSKPVLIIFSILAALQVFTAAANLNDLIGADVAAFLVLGVAAVQAGMSFYVNSLTVPVADTAAYVNQDGNVVAGPAAAPTNGTSVEVIPR